MKRKPAKCIAMAIIFAGQSLHKLGSGCGSVGRAVASDNRGPQFKSSHRQNFLLFIEHLFTVNCVLKIQK